MADKNKIKNWKHGRYIPMALVYCPGSNSKAWGNPSKLGIFRCTKCGAEHMVSNAT